MPLSRISLFVILLLTCSTSAFAFAGSSADCNADGIDDIHCSGTGCNSLDEGALPNVGGYCQCAIAGSGGKMDRKTCADLPSLAATGFLDKSKLWRQLLPLEQEETEEQDTGPLPASSEANSNLGARSPNVASTLSPPDRLIAPRNPRLFSPS